MLWKCCTQYASKSGNLNSGHRTRRGQFSFQSQRKAMPKNVQTITQKYQTITLISHASKIMLNSTWTMNFQMFKLDLEKVEEPEIELPASAESSKRQEFQKNIYLCFIDYSKGFDCVDHSRLWKILQKMGIPDLLTWLLWNLYAGQEATVRTTHGTMDWFQIGKGVHQSCILLPCLFNLHAEYIMQNAWLDEAWTGIKIARSNINSLRYADDTTVMAESKEELKSLLKKMKEQT